MQNKLQELTEKLYNEGLSKGKTEGEALLAKARSEADAIIAEAKKQAEAIVVKAQKDAEDLRTKTAGDIALASRQAVSETRQAVESLVITKAADARVKTALSDEEFVKTIITAAVKAFADGKDCGIEVCLPESAKETLEGFVKNEVAKTLKTDVEVKFCKKIGGGFTIGPKDGGYFINFTDEAFNELIGDYLRPATKKILFG